MTHEFSPLYKRGRGCILEWKVKIENRDKKVNIIMTYGTLNGQQVVRFQNDIKGKNKGKVNETTAWEQAILEAQSKVNLKLKEGYKEIDNLKCFFIGIHDKFALECFHFFTVNT